MRKIHFPRLVIPLSVVLTTLHELRPQLRRGRGLHARVRASSRAGAGSRSSRCSRRWACSAPGIGDAALGAVRPLPRRAADLGRRAAGRRSTPRRSSTRSSRSRTRRLQHLIMCSPLAVIVQQTRHAIIDPTAPNAAEAIGGGARLLIPIGDRDRGVRARLPCLQPLGAAHRRGTVTCVVVVPVYGARDLFEECLRSVVEHTHARHARAGRRRREPRPGHPGVHRAARRGGAAVAARLRPPRRRTSASSRNMNAVFARHGAGRRRDRQLRHGRARRLARAPARRGLLATGWWPPRARSPTTARSSRSPTATGPSPPPPPGLSITEADARIARASPRLHPRIPTGIGHCLYIRRSALELVGDFDETFSPGYGEEVDFSQRCLARGLRHVVADDLYVFHRGAGTFGDARTRAPGRQRGRAQPPLPLLREGGATRRRPRRGSRSPARSPPPGSRSASCR